MADDPVLQELQQIAGEHLAALVRQAYEAGKRVGESEARARVLAAFDAPIQPLREATRPPAAAKVATPLREAVAAMDIDETGVGAREVTIFINRLPESPLMTEAQVRAGMKALLTRGDVVRVARGRYRPSERLITEFAIDKAEAETEAPNSRTLFGAPKTNGSHELERSMRA
jgi:hypothetical protein